MAKGNGIGSVRVLSNPRRVDLEDVTEELTLMPGRLTQHRGELDSDNITLKSGNIPLQVLFVVLLSVVSAGLLAFALVK